MIGVVDLGGTKIATGIVDDDGMLRARREEPTRPTEGFDQAARRIVAMLEGHPLRGVAIGSTGPIDRHTGVFGRVDTLPGFEGHDLAKALRTGLGISHVVIENDADAAALGEATWGAGRGVGRFVYVTISTGIGAGIVLDGAIYRGAAGVHPELGHQVLEASGPPCSCGSRGCWEALASGPAMAKGHDATAEEICRRADEPWARAIVEREAFYLGVGLANVVTSFAPDVIALGGGVMRSAHLFLDRARAVMNGMTTLLPPDTTALTTATLGDDAVLLGAARAFALEHP